MDIIKKGLLDVDFFLLVLLIERRVSEKRDSLERAAFEQLGRASPAGGGAAITRCKASWLVSCFASCTLRAEDRVAKKEDHLMELMNQLQLYAALIERNSKVLEALLEARMLL